MKTIKTTPTSKEIKALLDTCGASQFTLDEETNEPGQDIVFLFGTRDNGDVGEETAGEEDILSAKTARPVLKDAYPDAKVTWETLDEWVHI